MLVLATTPALTKYYHTFCYFLLKPEKTAITKKVNMIGIAMNFSQLSKELSTKYVAKAYRN
jgi:hypothetical protein